MVGNIEIAKTEDGVRLMRWFLRNFPGSNLKELYKLCRGGQIRVNSKRCRGNEMLRFGDFVRIPPTVSSSTNKVQKTESGERFSLAELEKLRQCIIHDDEDMVIFNKPAGLATQGGTGIRVSLDKMASALFPYDKISLVHRLDKETSGILVVAKNQNSAQVLAREFQDRSAQKEYLAVLCGNVSPKAGVIEDVLHDKRAITKYEVIGESHGVFTFVRFQPKTGRKHQLRLHSAFELKAPIVGDNLYGRPDESIEPALESVFDRKKLHLVAYKLTFRHPGTGKQITVTAELPDFVKPVLKLFEWNV